MAGGEAKVGAVVLVRGPPAPDKLQTLHFPGIPHSENTVLGREAR